MTRLHTLLVAFLVGAVAVFGGGFRCAVLTGAEDNRDVERAVAEVDSLDVPPRISPTDTLTVRMYGMVGPNGCHSFERFDSERSGDRVRVTPVVARVTGEEVACTMAVVPLDRTYAVAPPFEPGTFTVVVPQPDRTDVTATVDVREAE